MPGFAPAFHDFSTHTAPTTRETLIQRALISTRQ
jgi:hypothetical protein